MADLFDALVARALGSTPLIAPVVPPRFAEPIELSEATVLRAADPPLDPGSEAASGTMRPATPKRPEALGDVAVMREITVERRSETVERTGDGQMSAISEPPPAANADHSRSTGQTDRVSRATERRAAEPRVGVPRADAAPVAPALGDQPLQVATGTVGPMRHSAVRPGEISPRAEDRHPAARQDSVPVISARPLPVPEERTEAEDQAARRPQVTISIGQVEVRAPVRPQPARVARSEPPYRPEPRLSLDEYLRRGQRR
jgi:hypothetical protein